MSDLDSSLAELKALCEKHMSTCPDEAMKFELENKVRWLIGDIQEKKEDTLQYPISEYIHEKITSLTFYSLMCVSCEEREGRSDEDLLIGINQYIHLIKTRT